MKKIVCFVLLTVMLFAVCGCGAAEQESFDESFVGETSGIDLGGFDMQFYVTITKLTNTDITDNVLGYTQDSLFAEKARTRINDVEKKLNCKITLNPDAKAELFAVTAASGSFFGDAYMSHSDLIHNWAKAGLLTGITTLSDIIDYKDADKWGQPNLLEVGFYDGELYGVLPAAWPELSYTSFGYPLVSNTDLITSLGNSDPREYVEAGTWNWEQFENMLINCTVKEGEREVYGLMTHYPYFSQMIIASNGVTFAQIDGKGDIECGYYTAEGMRALEEVYKIYQGELSYTVSKSGDGDATMSMENFIDGVGVFTFTPAHCIFGASGDISMKMENYGILPTPYGPDSSADEITSLYHSMYYIISLPVVADHQEETATILNEIFEPFEGLETYDEMCDYMAKNYFFDERDAETFFLMQKNAKLNYDYQTSFISRRIPESICNKKMSVTEIVESYRSEIDDVFEEVVIPMKTTYAVLFD